MCILTHRDKRRKQEGSYSCDKVSAHFKYVCCPAENTVCTGKTGFPPSVHASVVIFAHCLCFHSSDLNIYRPLCWDLWSLVWLVPQAMQGGRGSVDSCWCPQSAGVPDGVLIDFLVLSKFYIAASPTL